MAIFPGRLSRVEDRCVYIFCTFPAGCYGVDSSYQMKKRSIEENGFMVTLKKLYMGCLGGGLDCYGVFLVHVIEILDNI